MKQMFAPVVGKLIVGFARILTGLCTRWTPGSGLRASQTLYFVNHTSHADFVLVWATLPPDLRQRTRPVAAADYWGGSRLRRFIGQQVFNALLIDRVRTPQGPDPVRQMAQALQDGDSLIMFPEGTRNTSDVALLPLKSGLYRLALECPEVRLVPVWIENLRRVLPKGAVIPLPLACTVHYGEPLALASDEDKAGFLERARQALLSLRLDHEREDHP